MGTRQSNHSGCCIILAHKHEYGRVEYVEHIFYWFRSHDAYLCRFHGGKHFLWHAMAIEFEICVLILYVVSCDMEP